MNDKAVKRWRRIKERGLLRFILVNGMLMFGLTTTVLAYLIDAAWEHGTDVAAYFGDGWARELTEHAVQWVMTGIFWAVAVWLLLVKRMKDS